MTENEHEILMLLPQYSQGDLDKDDIARVENAIKNSELLKRELEEIRHFAKIAQNKNDPNIVNNAPSTEQITDILSKIRKIPQENTSRYKPISAYFEGLFKLKTYEFKPIFMQTVIGIFIIQISIIGFVYSQNLSLRYKKIISQEHLITRISPQTSWSAFNTTISNKQLKIISTTPANDFILASDQKYGQSKLKEIGEDLEASGVAQFAKYSDGKYLNNPIFCEEFHNNSLFKGRVSYENPQITHKFSTIDTIEGEIIGQTRNGPSKINLSNLGTDGGWVDMGTPVNNSSSKDSLRVLIGRFENDLNTEITKENLPIIRMNLQMLIGDDISLYPGKYIDENVDGPLNINYPASYYNQPNQSKITGFNLKICGHKR